MKKEKKRKQNCLRSIIKKLVSYQRLRLFTYTKDNVILYESGDEKR